MYRRPELAKVPLWTKRSKRSEISSAKIKLPDLWDSVEVAAAETAK